MSPLMVIRREQVPGYRVTATRELLSAEVAAKMGHGMGGSSRAEVQGGVYLAEGTACVQIPRGKELGTLGLLDGGPRTGGKLVREKDPKWGEEGVQGWSLGAGRLQGGTWR